MSDKALCQQMDTLTAQGAMEWWHSWTAKAIPCWKLSELTRVVDFTGIVFLHSRKVAQPLLVPNDEVWNTGNNF